MAMSTVQVKDETQHQDDTSTLTSASPSLALSVKEEIRARIKMKPQEQTKTTPLRHSSRLSNKITDSAPQSAVLSSSVTATQNYNALTAMISQIRENVSTVKVSSQIDYNSSILSQVLSDLDSLEKSVLSMEKTHSDKILCLEDQLAQNKLLLTSVENKNSQGDDGVTDAPSSFKSLAAGDIKSETASGSSASNDTVNETADSKDDMPLNLSKINSLTPLLAAANPHTAPFLLPVPNPEIIAHMQQVYGKEAVKNLLQKANIPGLDYLKLKPELMDFALTPTTDKVVLDENFNTTKGAGVSMSTRNPWLPSKQDSSPILDTSVVAANVRNLLSNHNIGQRLFAKHILGLSQGTVSELLSKPKPWEKLTEKGRESYRKMSAWSANLDNVLSLKSLSPKKGYSTGPGLINTQAQSTNETSETEKRIARILQQAKEAMGDQAETVRSPSPQLNSDAIQQIYKQQLDIANQHAQHLHLGMFSAASSSSGSGFLPHTSKKEKRIEPISILPSSSGSKKSPEVVYDIKDDHISSVKSLIESTSDEANISKGIVRRIYYEQLVKHLQFAEIGGEADKIPQLRQEIRDLEANFPELKETKRLNAGMKQCASSAGSKKLSASSRLSDSQQSSGGQSPHSSGKVMQQAALNLSVSPQLAAFQSSLMPLAFMPTALNFSMAQTGLQNGKVQVSGTGDSSGSSSSGGCSSLPLFNKHSKSLMSAISQEQFQRYTNLSTEDLVQQIKEVLSRFTISQRLFGEQVLGLSQGSVSDLLARPKPWNMLTQKGREPFIRMKIFLDDPLAVKKLMNNSYSPQSQEANQSAVTSRPESVEPLSRPSSANSIASSASQSQFYIPETKIGNLAKNISFDIDTSVVTSSVKEILNQHSVSYRVFCEAVLGMSQHAVNDLLNKPKPWSQLSIKGREPYLRMNLWLADPDNPLKLKLLQSESNNRRRSFADAGFDSSTSDSFSAQGSKRTRYNFTEEQREILLHIFNADSYPSSETMESIAAQFDLPFKSVANWFHNHRMRHRANQSSENREQPNEHQLHAVPANSYDESSVLSQSDLNNAGAESERPISKRKASKPTRLLLNNSNSNANADK